MSIAAPERGAVATRGLFAQRLFFLHDGRTNDLLAAIQAHASNGSEANGVIGKFNALSATTLQDILNFLRSLRSERKMSRNESRQDGGQAPCTP